MQDWSDRAALAADRKQRLLSFGPRARGVLVDTQWGPFVVDPEDNSVTHYLINDGIYAPAEVDLAASLLTLDDDMLLVGAHIGALAVPLSRRCRRLDAIEANPSTRTFLESNLRLNDCSNVTVYPFAASDKNEEIEFLLNRDCSGGSKRKPLTDRFFYTYDSPEIVKVPAHPLDEILVDRTYALIFMDIEGSEYFALKGMQSLLSKTHALAVEFLPFHFADVAGVGPAEFLAQVMPHFDWMYVPLHNQLMPKNAIEAVVHDMFARGEGHDNLYFLKTLPPGWAEARGLAESVSSIQVG